MAGYLNFDNLSDDFPSIEEHPQAFDTVVTDLIGRALDLMASVSQARTRDLQALWDLLDAIHARNAINLDDLNDYKELQRQLKLARDHAASLREELDATRAAML